jgi:CheY-like chemotaxis protein
MDAILHNHRLLNDPVQTRRGTSPGTGKASSGPLSVLVVDDEEIVRLVLSEMLERLGLAVTTVADGLAALERIEHGNHKFDLVVFDLTMPEMEGDELFYAIRRLDPEVRLVLSSGLFDNETVDQMSQHGLDGYLPKPYSIEQISALLNGIFGRR